MVTLFGELETSGDLRGTLRQRLQGGERLPGIGHWLYPEGDPRAKFLLELLQRDYSGNPALDLALRTAEAAEAMRLAGHKLPVDVKFLVREGAGDGHR